MPEWPRTLPRFPLLDEPSPFHELPRFAAALGGGTSIWIKREDLLPIGLGGNKLRNLEFLIGAALADGADTLVTTGRRWSNHARLTAAAGARAGLAVHLVLSGPATDPPTPGVRLDELLGATVHLTATKDRAERAALQDAVVADLRASGARPYVIGIGGSGPLGATGQVLAGWELFAQARDAGVVIDRIVVPLATGGTQAGLVVAAAGQRPTPRVIGVVVSRSPDELGPAVSAMAADLATDAGVTLPPAAVELDETQLGAGYGRPTDAADAATALLARTEGLLVDPIYTAKALASLVATVRSGDAAGETLVFWHAGGLPGLFEPLEAG